MEDQLVCDRSLRVILTARTDKEKKKKKKKKKRKKKKNKQTNKQTNKKLESVHRAQTPSQYISQVQKLK